jgi:two-component system, OmpR family, phosphate regulon sensor histidine kinase PhoR
MATLLKRASTQQLVFLAVAVLVCAQVGWWISLQIRESKRLQEARIERLKAGRAVAWQQDSLRILPFYLQKDPAGRTVGNTVSVEGRLPLDLPSLTTRIQTIERDFPYVQVVPAPIDHDDPPLLDQVGQSYLTLRQEPLREMERERRTAIWRATAEGSFMALGVLFGFVLIYRKLNEEMDLKLRQRNFIAAVTHELKTPIASLRVWVETLFQRNLSVDQRGRIHDLMDKDLARLTELVGNLLDVARADAGGLALMLAPLELGPWVKTLAEAMDQRLGAGSLGLKLELSKDMWVNGDPKALATALENLLSNAYKYSDAPRRTTITLDGNKDEVLLVINDRGIGIPSKELPQLFQRFYRVGDEMTRSVPGTGLGLFLVREIISRHGGDIRASSQGTGLGSSFTIRLPRLARAGEA